MDQYKEQFFKFEILELEKLEKVYFLGQSATRSIEEMNVIRDSEQEIVDDLDDKEGYYNVLIGDHLSYRYEIKSILGKGSFAQVVKAFDHKLQVFVAIKITRNTEIDHQFAESESRLLNFLMEKDPEDSYNIVRLMDEFYFRDHHCFVFELLETDLFEYMKENDFAGFSLNRIKNIAA